MGGLRSLQPAESALYRLPLTAKHSPCPYWDVCLVYVTLALGAFTDYFEISGKGP